MRFHWRCDPTKDNAAYRTTSIAVSAEDDAMSEEIKKALEGLTSGLDGLTKQFAELSASVEYLKKKGPEKVDANARTMSMVEPHALACEACADGMEAAGVGADSQNGHALVLRRVAGHLRAAAALGKVPHVFRDSDWLTAAADDKADDVSKKLDEMVKPLPDGLKALESKLADVKAAAVANVEAPARKTLSPAITTFLVKAGTRQSTTARRAKSFRCMSPARTGRTSGIFDRIFDRGPTSRRLRSISR
jgi:hypothetical protein